MSAIDEVDSRAQVFGDRHGLRRSSGAVCLARLIGKQCAYGREDPHPLCDLSHEWQGIGPLDHGTLWLRDGRPVLVVGQPYHLYAEELRELAELEGRYGLRVGIHGESWHNPGSCAVVELWALEPAERPREARLTPFSDLEATPPPRCRRCGLPTWYMGGTQKRKDERAHRSDPGWRCPVCDLERKKAK